MRLSSTIGVDLGDRWSRYCVLDQDGGKEDRVRTSAEALTQRFGQMPAIRIVLEAGTHSPWVSPAGEAGFRSDCGECAQSQTDIRERPEERPVRCAHVGTIRPSG